MISVADFMPKDQVLELLSVSDRTLRDYQAKFWKEGIHYAKPAGKVMYIGPMIADWALNHRTDPEAHKRAIEDWIKKCQKRAK